MFFETINVSSGSLNLGTLVVTQTTDLDPPAYQGRGDYHPRKIYVENKSGKTANYGLMTTREYNFYTGTLSYSSLKPIDTATTDTYENIIGEITYVLAEGTSGHTGSLNFYLVRE